MSFFDKLILVTFTLEEVEKPKIGKIIQLEFQIEKPWKFTENNLRVQKLKHVILSVALHGFPIIFPFIYQNGITSDL